MQSSFAGLRYEITCTVSKTGRSTTSATGYIIARSVPKLPTIKLDGLPSGGRVSPSDKVTLSATVTSVAPDQLSLLWTQKAGPGLNLSSPDVVATPLTTASLVLLPGALPPGSSFVFLLTATDPVGSVSAEVSLTSARAPRGLRGAAAGSIAAVVAGGVGNTAEGVAFATVFTLSASNWADEDGPLLYQFQYVVKPPTDASALGADAAALGAVPALPVTLAPFQPLDTLAGVTFPAGHESAYRTIVVQLCAAPRPLRAAARPLGHFPETSTLRAARLL